MKKQEFVYPGSDFDRSRNLIALLGSFWAKNYAGIDQLHSYADAVGEAVTQSYRNLLEVVASLSRFDVPLFHEELLVAVTLKKSDLNAGPLSRALFDRGPQTIDGTLAFDRPLQSEVFAFPLPPKLVDVAHFFNRVALPTAALAKNIDFIIDVERGAIIFAVNPFNNPAFIRRPFERDGRTDEEITLWGFCGRYDYNYVFEQFAYAVALSLKTSQGAKDLMNAVTTGLIDGGASAKTLDNALAAICGIPVTVDPREVVEEVRYDNHGLFVATDRNVYRFGHQADAIVNVGQELPAGSYLIRGFDVSEFYTSNTYISATDTQPTICCATPAKILSTVNDEELITEAGENIALSLAEISCRLPRRDISALALDSGFLSACFYGDLVFENKEVPLEVDTAHPLGFTYVKFGLGGLPADVERFFDELHARGVQAATQQTDPCVPGRRRGTLAQLLDRRAQPDGQPTAEHLPRTINPLKFLVENVLRNNVFVVRIFVPALGQNQLGLYNIRHLRQLIPPQTAMIVVFELAGDFDTLKAEDYITESAHTFTGMSRLTNTVPATLIRDIGVTARLVSGTCQ